MYALQLRATALEAQVREQVLGLGYSRVNLEKSRGHRGHRCEIRSAGFNDAGTIEDPLTDYGPAPLYKPHNPTDASSYVDSYNPRKSWRPQFRGVFDTVIVDVPADAPGPRWQARCADRFGGTATGHTSDVSAPRRRAAR